MAPNLLELPFEIRERIYFYVVVGDILRPEEGTTDPSHTSRGRELQFLNCGQKIERGTLSKELAIRRLGLLQYLNEQLGDSHLLDTRLLKVHPQIASEASKVLYRCNTFGFANSYELHGFAYALTPRQASLIRKYQLNMIWRTKSDIEFWDLSISSLLSKLPAHGKQRSLDLTVCLNFNSQEESHRVRFRIHELWRKTRGHLETRHFDIAMVKVFKSGSESVPRPLGTGDNPQDALAAMSKFLSSFFQGEARSAPAEYLQDMFSIPDVNNSW